MIEKEAIQLKQLSAQIEPVQVPVDDRAKTITKEGKRLETPKKDEDKFVVRLKVFNPENRTLYAYGTARRILYNNATCVLSLNLHDRDISEEGGMPWHLPIPKFVPLEGNAETEIKITLPLVVNRIRSANERTGGEPMVEQLFVSEAKEIDVEVAHQDTPFYYNPKVSVISQLQEWGRPISKADFKITPSTQEGGRAKKPDTKRSK